MAITNHIVCVVTQCGLTCVTDRIGEGLACPCSPKAMDLLRDSEVRRSLPRARELNKPKPPQGSPLQTDTSLAPLVPQRDGDPLPHTYGGTHQLPGREI